MEDFARIAARNRNPRADEPTRADVPRSESFGLHKRADPVVRLKKKMLRGQASSGYITASRSVSTDPMEIPELAPYHYAPPAPKTMFGHRPGSGGRMFNPVASGLAGAHSSRRDDARAAKGAQPRGAISVGALRGLLHDAPARGSSCASSQCSSSARTLDPYALLAAQRGRSGSSAALSWGGDDYPASDAASYVSYTSSYVGGSRGGGASSSAIGSTSSYGVDAGPGWDGSGSSASVVLDETRAADRELVRANAAATAAANVAAAHEQHAARNAKPRGGGAAAERAPPRALAVPRSPRSEEVRQIMRKAKEHQRVLDERVEKHERGVERQAILAAGNKRFSQLASSNQSIVLDR